MKIKSIAPQKTAIAQYIDDAINFQVNIEYFSNYVTNKIDKLQKKSEQQKQSDIYQAMDFAPAGWGLSAAENAVRSIIFTPNQYDIEAQNVFNEALKSVSEYSTLWTENQMNDAENDLFIYEQPAPIQVYTAAMSQPFEGRYLNEWWNDNSAATQKKIMQNFRIGYLNGQTTGNITNEVIKSLKDSKSISTGEQISTNRKNIESIVRTGISHMANESRMTVAKANSDVIEGVTFVATLDTRTCAICGGYDGRTWAIDDTSKPNIPVHFRCRCTWAFKTKQLVPGQDFTFTRASMDGQVSSKVTYSDWLANQSAARQDEILGKTKGDMYRKGAYNPTDFTNLKSNMYNEDSLNSTIRKK